MTRDIAFLIDGGFDLLDLSGPLEAFYIAKSMAPGNYRLTVMSPDGGLVESVAGLPVMTERAQLNRVDTLLVIGGPANIESPPPALVTLVKRARRKARRIAAVCIGAFVLAEAGLLDGKTATTHWGWAAKLQALHPNIDVDGDRIFTSDNGIWTSAGITAAIDLSLALIEEDLGANVARAVARMMVIYHRRSGGQMQHSSLLEQDSGSDRVRRVLTYARENLNRPLGIDELAEVANLSTRQFGRVFAAATQTTPAKAVERLRVDAAMPRIEEGRESLDEIARTVGFVDASRMRQGFIRVTGHSPQGIRRMFRHEHVR